MPDKILRAFIAVPIPAPIQESIARSIAGLQKDLPYPIVRWVAVHNVHLTIKFLGDITTASLEQVSIVLASEISRLPRFSLTVGSLGAFPNPRRARIVWVGIQAPPDLASLENRITSTCSRLGYPAEARPFSPHLTLGRVGRQVTPNDLERIYTALEKVNIGVIGTAEVGTVHIYKSDLTRSGSIYTQLFSIPLAA